MVGGEACSSQGVGRLADLTASVIAGERAQLLRSHLSDSELGCPRRIAHQIATTSGAEMNLSEML